MVPPTCGFISTLPKEYQTQIGEQGATISGGEKQRIALSRAFLFDRPILILDEASSQLDTKIETSIQESLQRTRKKRTTIIVAHRLSTIEHADLIVVMDQGRIVEQGTHQELLAQEGMYFQLYHKTVLKPNL